MYVRAGVLSLSLLILSRVMGLLRESAQAAAFGSSGLGDAVIVMFTLPDWLVSMLFGGALSYVLLPLWAQQSPAEQQDTQQKVGRVLLITSLLMGVAIWLFRDLVSRALAPGLKGEMQALAAASFVWSAAVLPFAVLATLWATRLQHERDFVGMYAGSLVVNALLVLALFVTAKIGAGPDSMLILGTFLAMAMLARLVWLYWRLPKASTVTPSPAPLPKAGIWLWAGLSSGLLLLLPLIARSLASQSGEGALASFNYAWKLIELPLVLAIQLVASLAFPAITQTEAGSAARHTALHTAFLLAWALACAAVAVVATFSLPIAGLLFGWGRMAPEHLVVIADWSAVGVWSLLPQALIAVVLTLMAASHQMHVAAWAYVAGVLALAGAGWTGLSGGEAVMWTLNAVLSGVALALLANQRRQLSGVLAWPAMLTPLVVCLALVSCRPWFAGLGLVWSLLLALLWAILVCGSAVLASPLLRSWVRGIRPGTGQGPAHIAP